MSEQQTLTLVQPLPLECGGELAGVQIAYHSYGTLNSARDNVLWVCHALTANADVESWWPGLVGPSHYYDPAEWFIVCANVLGSCYGTTGPISPVPPHNRPLYQAFPRLTVRDLVAAHEQLRQHLGIEKIHTVIGGSLGGQQALEWTIAQPKLFDYLVLLATNARHSPWGIAFNEAQRLAIQADCTYQGGGLEGGVAGLRAARAIALLSYRSYDAYGRTQAEPDHDTLPAFYRASSYQQYQGDKLTARFNAYSYVTLSHIMDSHNVGRGRGGLEAALAQVQARTLVLGISSDVLFPPAEQQFIARHIPGAMYAEMDSPYGHDGFLIETAQITHFLERFYVQTFVH
ncbi:homoserine O-acetyltransferase MetX [Solirubrum puertoriconensis]|uniref:Homoserine O-acetyltransferase n=1 Tax=Solirubrum puertoriconensis TaxID=1751427 RepID=A0A9X0HLK9_SOLP1|nr:homoserine O-acetyltransferase [Solirubrum puertoriconensis]KUG08241.1 homoserine O-acetyltransferase [Solirubrum puertoriconensis]